MIKIFYERKQRELENIVLLKIEIEKRGHECELLQYYEADKYSMLDSSEGVVLTPSLYNTKSLARTLSRSGKNKKILNLQWEQVLSPKWEKLGHHNPNGEAIKANHICWGIKTKERLKKAGIKDENLKLTGAIQCDLLMKKYQENKRTDLSETYSLDNSKKWNLFLSSFTYADISENRLKMNENVAGTNLSDFKKIHTESRNEILKWLEMVLMKNREDILIYRPHPDEIFLEKVIELSKKYKNFKIIRELPVKSWISNSDKIFTWYSTSIVEAHFLDKPYEILRPIKLPKNFDSVLLGQGKYIEEYEEFEKSYLGIAQENKALSDEEMENYYLIDKEIESFKKIVDVIEDMLKTPKEIYQLTLREKLEALLKTLAIKALFSTYKVNKKIFKDQKNEFSGNKIKNWFTEWDNQIATAEEIQELEEKLKKLLGN